VTHYPATTCPACGRTICYHPTALTFRPHVTSHDTSVPYYQRECRIGASHPPYDGGRASPASAENVVTQPHTNHPTAEAVGESEFTASGPRGGNARGGG
jgi:hypothetical protein